jgi:O-antigen ligase
MRPSSFILGINRVYGVASEPASLVDIVSYLVLPAELSKYLIKRNIFSVLKIIILLPIIFFTRSTTVYVGFIVNMIVFLFFLFEREYRDFKN